MRPNQPTPHFQLRVCSSANSPSHSYTHSKHSNINVCVSVSLCARAHSCASCRRQCIMISWTQSGLRHCPAYGKCANCVRNWGWVGWGGCFAFILYISDMTAGASCLRRTLWERSVLSEESGARSVLYISSPGTAFRKLPSLCSETTWPHVVKLLFWFLFRLNFFILKTIKALRRISHSFSWHVSLSGRFNVTALGTAAEMSFPSWC